MILRITSRLCSDHTYDEAEIQLCNSSYLLHSSGAQVFASYDFDAFGVLDKQDKMREIELDLLNLGLLVESSYYGIIV